MSDETTPETARDKSAPRDLMPNEANRDVVSGTEISGVKPGVDPMAPEASSATGSSPETSSVADAEKDAEAQPRPKSKAKPKPVITSIDELLAFAYESNARLLDWLFTVDGVASGSGPVAG